MSIYGNNTIFGSEFYVNQSNNSGWLAYGTALSAPTNETAETGYIYIRSADEGDTTVQIGIYDITDGRVGSPLVGSAGSVFVPNLSPAQWLSVDLSSNGISLTSGRTYAAGISGPDASTKLFRVTGNDTSQGIVSNTSLPANWAESTANQIEYSFYVETVPAAVGPTITGPDSTTDGTNTVETGTLLDTVTIQSLISGSYEVIQSIDTQIPAQLEYIANSGVNDCVPGTPVAGVPLEATITAPGITPYVVQQKVDDGVNPPSTRDITLNAPATHSVIQTMIASANTIDDQSIFGASWIDVEDNMQATPPKQVDGVNFTWNADGTFTTDQDKTVNVRVPYFAPSTGQYGCINLTIQGSSIKPTGVNKNKRQSLTYQFYYNKNWRDKFQGGGE